MASKQISIKELAEKHGRERKSLIPILQHIVAKKQFVNSEDMVDVARELDLSAAEVYGTASFYSFLDIKMRGEYVIRVCQTITCDMKGKKEIIEAIEDTLKIKVGDTTVDKKFSLLPANCIGWCHKGPAMLINNEVFTDLTPKKASEIVESYMHK